MASANTKMDVKGINANGIANILSRLDSYKNAINSSLVDVGTIEEGKLQNAIKGDATVASVKAFGQTIKAGCQDTLNQLDQFKIALENLRASYDKNDQANNSFKINDQQ
ncbi:MAG: hypothetical protein HFG40_03065 [Bacilli bacterium]|nr:hypothetical protein [Bacilli bacterium]